MLKWINKKRNQKGFTLIELVVVIAILGILAALAIPRLTGSRENAQRKTILANLRTIDSAITLAQAETGTVATTVAMLTKDGSDSIGEYLAKDPSDNPVAGESYGILVDNTDPDNPVYGGRATVTLTSANGGAVAGTAYTVEVLQGLTGWKN